MTARFLVGDVFERMAELPDGSVDLIVTSPPFLALRSYLPADHPDKALEIGSEATPAEFLDVLLALTAEWRRVLTPHGSIAVELGDTYAGRGGAGGDYNPGGLREGQDKFEGSGYTERQDTKYAKVIKDGHKAGVTNLHGKVQGGGLGWPLDKCLTFIPELYGVALAYGINPLTGGESPAGRWRVRNKIAWCRPNPPVGALGDKCRPATSYITVATVARDRWWDMEECRTPPQLVTDRAIPGNNVKGSDSSSFRFAERLDSNPAGAPLLDYWVIPTQPYRGAHYATFPEELPRRLILAMCPREVCRECGKPRRRVVETERTVDGRRADETTPLHHPGRASNGGGSYGENHGSGFGSISTTLGWTDCGCCCGRCDACDPPIIGGPWPCRDKWRPGIVLDPFAGSGTTLAVAQGLGRDSIGIDLDSRNADLARERVGMFLEVEGDTGERVVGHPRMEGSGWHRSGNRPEHPYRKLPPKKESA